MSVELVLEDLKTQFGERKVLYARDIATILGQRQDRVRRLLNSRSLPLKLIDVGGHKGVSLYEMAQWLAEGEPQGLGPGHPAGESGGKCRKGASPSKISPSPSKDGGGVADPEPEAGNSLVAKILSMRHDAASFIVDQVSVSQTLSTSERHFWWSVIKNLDLDRGKVPGLVLKVVRRTNPSEQTTALKVYDLNQLDRVRDEMVGIFLYDAAVVVRITLKDEAAGHILVKATRDGERQVFVIDKVDFSDLLRAASSSQSGKSGQARRDQRVDAGQA